MENYQPNPQVLERLKQVHFVAVVGPTASGKTTLIQAVVAQDPTLHMVRNNTSRPPRPREVGSGEYSFLSRETMLGRIERGEYVQVAPTVLGDLYATAPEDYSTRGIAMLPVLSVAIPVFAALPFASFKVVYVLPPDYASWQVRIGAHDFTPEQLRKRLQEAAQSLDFACSDTSCLFVINGDLNVATRYFKELVCNRVAQTQNIHKATQQAGRELAHVLHQQIIAAL